MAVDSFFTKKMLPSRNKIMIYSILYTQVTLTSYLTVNYVASINKTSVAVSTLITHSPTKILIPDSKKATLIMHANCYSQAPWKQLNLTHVDTAWTNFKSNSPEYRGQLSLRNQRR